MLAGLPKGWVGSAYASDVPETADIKLGIIALTDCPSIPITIPRPRERAAVMAHAEYPVLRERLITFLEERAHHRVAPPAEAVSTMLIGAPAPI